MRKNKKLLLIVVVAIVAVSVVVAGSLLTGATGRQMEGHQIRPSTHHPFYAHCAFNNRRECIRNEGRYG